MIKKTAAFVFAALIAFALSVTALAATPAVPVEEDKFYAADYAGVLTDETKAAILSTNQSLRTSTGAEIVVVTTDFTDGHDIAEYAEDIGNDWGVGSKQYNNGMVLVLSIGADDYYCAVGTGFNSLAGKLQTVLDTQLEPDFAAKNYDAGVLKCVGALAELVTESGIGGEGYVKDNSDYTFSGFRQNAAGGMAYAAMGTVGALVVIIVVLVLGALIFCFIFAGSRRTHVGGGMPLWPFLFMGRRRFPPHFGGFHHRGPHHRGPRGGGGFGGFGRGGGGGFGGFGGGGGFSGGGAGRR